MSNLLNEGRYDAVTTQLTKEIMDVVKRGVKKYQTRIRLYSRTFVDVVVNIKYDPKNEKPIVYGGTYLTPKEIRKSFKYKRIILHVEVSDDESKFYEKKNILELVGELKNIIRHEIEHVAQNRFKEKEREGFFSKHRGYPKDLEHFEYLMEPYEREAYVRGLYQKAKNMKEPLNVLIDEFGNYLESIGTHPDEINAVLNSWRDYAKKHLFYTPYRRWGFIVDREQQENLDNHQNNDDLTL